jgi:ubiquinone/menaquinone biosynthesis C-methylase UbiE
LEVGPPVSGGYFATRFIEDPRRQILWDALCRYYFSRFIGPGDTVVDLGCGYGHFINAVTARRRIAVDSWADARKHLQAGVEFHAGSIDDLSFLADRSVNFVMASNIFEHVSQDVFRAVLGQLRRAFANEGTLCILQPNFAYAYRQYFDDYTHVAIYSHVSVCDFLQSEGFEILSCSPRFLPLSVVSRLPIHPLLIRLYLLAPWKPRGKQMLIRCRPADGRQ